jgi:hypothetical protein
VIDKYETVRREEHSTLLDATVRHTRDADAFTSGAQYALDKLLGQNEIYDGPVNHMAADILTAIHKGEL